MLCLLIQDTNDISMLSFPSILGAPICEINMKHLYLRGRIFWVVQMAETREGREGLC